MSVPKQVWLLGAHPSEGSISMEVYQEAISKELRKRSDIKLTSWPESEGIGSRGGRLVKALGRYGVYPARVLAQRSRYDVVHICDHSSGYLLDYSSGSGRKQVVTLHDLIPLRYPDGLSPRQVSRFRRVTERLRKADHVVSVSEYSKQEAVDLLGLAPQQIQVVPNGVDRPTVDTGNFPQIDSMREIGADFIVISIGSAIGRKNLKASPEYYSGIQ